MNSQEAIKLGLDMADMISMAYLEDLSDEDLMKRPAEGCNHINWQVGHLIASENQILNGVLPGSMPALPDGFAERYTKETAASDDAAQFCSKEQLLAAHKTQRAATLAALAKASAEELDTPGPEEMKAYAPTVGAALSMQGSHWLMHAGQWAVVRRQLGRAPLF